MAIRARLHRRGERVLQELAELVHRHHHGHARQADAQGVQLGSEGDAGTSARAVHAARQHATRCVAEA